MPDDEGTPDTGQIVDWIHEYFPESQWATAQSIALRESGYNAGAINNTSRPDLPGYHAPAPGNSPEYSIGIFQINTEAWNTSGLDLTDPLTNIQAAAAIWQSSGWVPWGGVPGYAPPGQPGAAPIGSTQPGGGTQTTPPTIYQPGGGGGGTSGPSPIWFSFQIPGDGGVTIPNPFYDLQVLLQYLEVNAALIFARLVCLILGTVFTFLGATFLIRSL